MSIRQIILGAAAVIVVAGGLLLAQGPGLGRGMHQHRFEKMQEFVATYLDLSESQKTEAERIFAAARETAKPVKEQLRQQREAVLNAVKAGDQERIERLSQSTGAMVGRLMAIHTKAASEFYLTLTAEQKAKAEKLPGQLRGMLGRGPFAMK